MATTRRTRAVLSLVLAALLAPAPSVAVGWTDADGVVHFTEPPKVRRIEIYMTSWCPACRKAREWFQDRKVEFTEYDLEKDDRAVLRRRQLDGSTIIPLVVIDGEVIKGFRPGEFQSALDRRTDPPQKRRTPGKARRGIRSE